MGYHAHAAMSAMSIVSRPELVGLCAQLGADGGQLSPAEARLVDRAASVEVRAVRRAKRELRGGRDVLGDAYAALRSKAERRKAGATYTPDAIVQSMVRWATDRGEPARVVDAGAGTGRFAAGCAAAFPDADIVAVERDPLAALCLRARAAVDGFADRLEVRVSDYCGKALPRVDGQTLFIGNPPYVRHHELTAAQKNRLARAGRALGYRASLLAGLHVHFIAATAALHAADGDYGAFVTSAEWLEVNYGAFARSVMADVLGLTGLHVIAPEAEVFPDAMTTAAIATFEVGAQAPRVRYREVERVSRLGRLRGGTKIPRDRLTRARWTHLAATPRRANGDMVELGELVRIHRGQVTGANAVWIAGDRAADLPASVLFPAITRARELFDAAPDLDDASGLRRVIDLPTELDALDSADRAAVKQFLRWARRTGAHTGYVARHRRAWWSVGLREPAPILATYMARRPPAFVRNRACARHINIAHGLYPRTHLTDRQLDELVAFLATGVRTAEGRTYAGGLTKFEPKEMEQLLVPRPR